MGDVMVVWTKRAECKNSGLSPGCTLTTQTRANMFAKINLAVDETNTAFSLSGINTELRLVHNVGCNHDRGSENKCSSNEANFGYRDKDAKFRDIMAYDCKSGQCDNVVGKTCTRVQRFSNRAHTYNGYPIGDSECDCASRVNTNTFRVIDYFPAKTEEELVELGQFEYENDPPTQAPVAPNCRAKNGSCNRNDLCCSNRCKWRRCT